MVWDRILAVAGSQGVARQQTLGGLDAIGNEINVIGRIIVGSCLVGSCLAGSCLGCGEWPGLLDNAGHGDNSKQQNHCAGTGNNNDHGDMVGSHHNPVGNRGLDRQGLVGRRTLISKGGQVEVLDFQVKVLGSQEDVCAKINEVLKQRKTKYNRE